MLCKTEKSISKSSYVTKINERQQDLNKDIYHIVHINGSSKRNCDNVYDISYIENNPNQMININVTKMIEPFVSYISKLFDVNKKLFNMNITQTNNVNDNITI